MDIDARPYRAGFNPNFLKAKGFSTQSGPHKLNGDDRSAIAKAYYAGCSPKELAEEYGTSPAHVIQIARRYDLDRYQARKRVRKARVVIEAPVIATPEPEPEPIDEAGRFYVVHRDGMVS